MTVAPRRQLMTSDSPFLILSHYRLLKAVMWEGRFENVFAYKKLCYSKFGGILKVKVLTTYIEKQKRNRSTLSDKTMQNKKFQNKGTLK